MKQVAMADLQKADQLYQNKGKENDRVEALNQLAEVRRKY
jgi:hypothetical protein